MIHVGGDFGDGVSCGSREQRYYLPALEAPTQWRHWLPALEAPTQWRHWLPALEAPTQWRHWLPSLQKVTVCEATASACAVQTATGACVNRNTRSSWYSA